MARATAGKVEQALEELRQVPPREFTKKRNALAAAMANEGLKKEAAAVKASRKPTPSVWAIGALARNDPATVTGVLNAGAAVRREQRRAVSGAGPGVLREVTREFHAAVSAAARAAERLLQEAGERPSPSVVARIRQTLLASAEAPDEARTAIREGALDEDLSPVGFGDRQTIAETRRESALQERELREERRRRDALLRAELEQRERDLRAASAEEQRLERIARDLEERAREARERAALARAKTEQARRARDETQQKARIRTP